MKLYGLSGLISLERDSAKGVIHHNLRVALKSTNEELGVCGACVAKLLSERPVKRDARLNVLVKDRFVPLDGSMTMGCREVYLDEDERGSCKLCLRRSDVAVIVSVDISLKRTPEAGRSQWLEALQSLDSFLKLVDVVFMVYLGSAKAYFEARFEEHEQAAKRAMEQEQARQAVLAAETTVVGSGRYKELDAARRKIAREMEDLLVIEALRVAGRDDDSFTEFVRAQAVRVVDRDDFCRMIGH